MALDAIMYRHDALLLVILCRSSMLNQTRITPATLITAVVRSIMVTSELGVLVGGNLTVVVLIVKDGLLGLPVPHEALLLLADDIHDLNDAVQYGDHQEEHADFNSVLKERKH
jgi:hypothetical protein